MSEHQYGLSMQCDLTSVLDDLGEDFIRDKWPKVLNEYVDVAIARLKREGVKEKQARSLAYAVVEDIANYRGGKNEYLPTGDKLQQALKHIEMWFKFYNNESDVPALAEQYGMNEIAVYAVLKEQRRLHSAKIQPDMFTKEKVQ